MERPLIDPPPLVWCQFPDGGQEQVGVGGVQCRRALSLVFRTDVHTARPRYKNVKVVILM